MPIAVWRPAAKVPALQDGLGGHRRSDPHLDPIALALAHAAEDRHHEVVGFVVRIQGSTHLRYPQLDSIVDEQRKGQTELIAVERPMGLTDHDGLEATVDPLERREQRCALGRRCQGSDRDSPMSK
jgi:hypothetical protein